MRILSLDIGGTNIRSAIVNGTKIVDYKKVPMPAQKRTAIRAILQTIESYGGLPDALCVSVAGFERHGILQNAFNLPIDGIAFSRLLREEFKTKIFVENDANCACLAEHIYGAGKGRKHFVLLTLGTGIGCGAVLDGKLYRGRGGAVEVGATWMDGDFFEHWASGNASVKLAHTMFDMKDITSLELEEKANAGDRQALRVYNMVGHYLGIGLANLTYIFDPELFVLGGGFSRVKHIYSSMRESYARHYTLTPRVEIVKAKLGDNAGLIGAALLAKVK